MLCSWARHLTLTVPLSTQVYKWVPANCWGNVNNCWGVTCDGLASCPGGVEILLAASCYGNQDKLRPDEPVLAPKASLYFHFFFSQYASSLALQLLCSIDLDPRLSALGIFMSKMEHSTRAANSGAHSLFICVSTCHQISMMA